MFLFASQNKKESSANNVDDLCNKISHLQLTDNAQVSKSSWSFFCIVQLKPAKIFALNPDDFLVYQLNFNVP